MEGLGWRKDGLCHGKWTGRVTVSGEGIGDEEREESGGRGWMKE